MLRQLKPLLQKGGLDFGIGESRVATKGGKDRMVERLCIRDREWACSTQALWPCLHMNFHDLTPTLRPHLLTFDAVLQESTVAAVAEVTTTRQDSPPKSDAGGGGDLRVAIMAILASGSLSNQEINAALRRSGRFPRLAKKTVNMTLHSLRGENVLQYELVGQDKRWSHVVSSK